MVSDAISRECRTSGQEWGEEITENFQGLGRKACTDHCRGRAQLRLEHRQHPTPWARNGTQSSSFRLGHIYSFLYLVTQGCMVQEETLSFFPSSERFQLWLVYILEAVDPVICHLRLGCFFCGIGAA